MCPLYIGLIMRESDKINTLIVHLREQNLITETLIDRGMPNPDMQKLCSFVKFATWVCGCICSVLGQNVIVHKTYRTHTWHHAADSFQRFLGWEGKTYLFFETGSKGKQHYIYLVHTCVFNAERTLTTHSHLFELSRNHFLTQQTNAFEVTAQWLSLVLIKLWILTSWCFKDEM